MAEEIPANLKPWDVERYQESQATGQPFMPSDSASNILQDYESPQRFRTLLQGGTYNAADEAEAAIVSATTGRPYPEVIGEIRTKLKNYQMDQPTESLFMEMLGGLVPSAAVYAVTRGKAKAAPAAVTAENASKVFSGFFPNLAKVMGIGSGEAVLSSIGRQEGNLLDRMDPIRLTAEGTTGGVMSGGIYGGGKALVKGASLAIDALRLVARRTDKDIVNREIQRIVADAGVSPEEAAQMLYRGEAVANDPQVAEALAGLRARYSGEAASEVTEELRPRQLETQEEAFETVASGLGGGMNKNTLEISRQSQNQLQKTVREAYQGIEGMRDPVTSEVLDVMVNVIARFPEGGRALQDAFKSKYGYNLFSIQKNGDIVFNQDPTAFDAEFLRRVVSEESRSLTEKGGAKATIGVNIGEAANDLKTVIDKNYEGITSARNTASNAFDINDAYNAGKSSKTGEPILLSWQDVVESGNQDAIDAFRLGYLVQLRSRLRGGNKTTMVNKLLDDTTSEGETFRAIFPEHMIDDAFEKLGVAQRTQKAAATILGGSQTTNKAAAAAKIGSASGIANVLTDVGAASRGDAVGLARTLDGIMRLFAPNLSPSQAERVARVLISRDPDIVNKALRDRTVLRSIQKTIAQVTDIPLDVMARSASRAGLTAMSE